MARPVPSHAAAKAAPPPLDVADRDALIAAREPRNLAVLVGYQIVLRVGWIFKTESLIIPAFLDYVGGTSILRGCLPVLSRFGQSVPPALLSRRLKVAPSKSRALGLSTLGMALPFLGLSAVWFLTGGQPGAWMPYGFLVLYAIFFSITGYNKLAMNTLQGKLIQPARRGRLMSLASTIGCPLAILAAWLMLGPWLELPDKGFGHAFGFCGLMFLFAAVATQLVVEPNDDYREAAIKPHQHFSAAWRVVRRDGRFRRLALVTALFSFVLMLFPHYQALARARLGMDLKNLVWWVMVQNAGTGLFSLLAGPVADRCGYRLVLRLSILCCALTPITALALVYADADLARRLFWIVFVLTGLTPIAIKSLTNYTLEIAPPAEHPRYVSTLNLCVSAPILLLSPLLGWLIGLTSFEFVFALGAALTLVAALLALRLEEPRHNAS